MRGARGRAPPRFVCGGQPRPSPLVTHARGRVPDAPRARATYSTVLLSQQGGGGGGPPARARVRWRGGHGAQRRVLSAGLASAPAHHKPRARQRLSCRFMVERGRVNGSSFQHRVTGSLLEPTRYCTYVYRLGCPPLTLLGVCCAHCTPGTPLTTSSHDYWPGLSWSLLPSSHHGAHHHL